MKKKMFLLSEEGTKVVYAESLEDFYSLIGCNCINIVSRKIGDRFLEIICDDEGLLKEYLFVSAMYKNGNPALVGNLLISGPADEEGDLTDLTDEDVEVIRNNLVITEIESEDAYKQYYQLKLS